MEPEVDRDGAAMLYRAAPRTDGSRQYQQHVIRHFSVMHQSIGSFLCAIKCSHTIKATSGKREICAYIAVNTLGGCQTCPAIKDQLLFSICTSDVHTCNFGIIPLRASNMLGTLCVRLIYLHGRE